ncbi:hypothetical protein ACFX13_005150 [Malus domestica]|uniref:uncharacterized protein n=1 Tax=Malus domestica TaxID=3750 RepID=UPI0004988CC7|nr:uncharacterized protein LOC103446476 [Malus domestica]
MEENASLIIWEFNILTSIPNLQISETMTNFCASISSSPLFSSIVALYALILLYLPNHFLRIVLSPVLIITGILLLTILRIGAIQRIETEDDERKQMETNRSLLEGGENRGSSNGVQEQIPSLQGDQEHRFFDNQSETDSESEAGFDPNPCFEDLFVEWNLKAPLEVIYEEYEGEENEVDPNENDPDSNRMEGNQVLGLDKHPSLSLYYPESDSDSSSDGRFSVTGVWDSPEAMCFRWEEDREGLIEIALDGNSKRGSLDFRVDHDHEEENLIEIDISPTRSNEFCAEKWQFSGDLRFS